AVAATMVQRIQVALDGMLGAGNTLVEQFGGGTTFRISFIRDLTNAKLPQLTIISPSFTPAAATVTAATIFDGIGNEVQTLALSAGVNGTPGGEVTLRLNGQPATGAALIFNPGSSPTAAEVTAHLRTIGFGATTG